MRQLHTSNPDTAWFALKQSQAAWLLQVVEYASNNKVDGMSFAVSLLAWMQALSGSNTSAVVIKMRHTKTRGAEWIVQCDRALLQPVLDLCAIIVDGTENAYRVHAMTGIADCMHNLIEAWYPPLSAHSRDAMRTLYA